MDRNILSCFRYLKFSWDIKTSSKLRYSESRYVGNCVFYNGVLLCIISAALGIYTAKLDKLHLQLIENGTKVKGLVEKVYLQKYTRYRRQIPYRILYSFTYHDKVYYHKSRLVWEKPDLKKGDLITVYVNNLGKSTVYNCNEAV